MASQSIKVLWARRLNYRAGLELQTILAERHHKQLSENSNALILCEHEPVYTVGIRDKSYTIEEEKKLRNLGAEFYRTNRGGLITFHGPGQLVAYPIFNLRHFRMSIRCFVSTIEKLVIRVCAEFGIKAGTSPHTGVWVEDRKICAIGLRASRYVTTHGLAMNCNTNLKWFDYILPCGIEGKEVTSISRELGVEITMKDVLPLMKRAFMDEFECSIQEFSEAEIYELLRNVRERVEAKEP